MVQINLGSRCGGTQGLKNMPGMIPKRHSPELAIRSPERESDLDAEYAPSRKFGGIIQTCSERDCKRNVFMKEALRWVKQALKGVGVVIDEHPIATTALIIGVSILLAEVISGGMLVTAAFDLIGFGAKGHIKGKVAAAFQSKVTKIQVGSLFSQLQSAAMNGATVMHLQNMAKTLVHMLIGLGAAQLASEGIKTIGQSSILDPLEWRTWESESRIEAPSNASVQVAQFWKAPESEGCVSYGYQKFRAALWFVPEGVDPLTACVRTPALIDGISYKTPLNCVNEDHKKGVVGTWYVPTNGTQCKPWWNAFENEGCAFYGRRRKFARLMGLNHNDNWNAVCESTPATIDGEHHEGPSYCEDKGVLGIFGIFDIVDKTCECHCVHE